jgi:hypothetical protein
MEDAAAIYDCALDVMGGFEAACIVDKPDRAALPSGLLTCGEAMLLIPALLPLILNRYPGLIDDESRAEALQTASLVAVSGELN